MYFMLACLLFITLSHVFSAAKMFIHLNLHPMAKNALLIVTIIRMQRVKAIQILQMSNMTKCK